MAAYGKFADVSSMDWKDNTSSTTFPHIGTPSKTLLASRTSLIKRETPSQLLRRTSPLVERSFNGPVEPPKYTSVLQKMYQLAGQGNAVLPQRPPRGLEVAPLPKDTNSFLEKQRHECTESLLASERIFVKTAQEGSQEVALSAENEKFKFHALQDLSILASTGASEMLRKQRERREELKLFSKMDPTHIVGDRTMTEEELAFSRTLRECNEAILCNREVDLAGKFTNLVAISANPQAAQLWQAFRAMTSLEAQKPSPKTPAEFRATRVFQEGILSRGRGYLEQTVCESALNRSGLSVHNVDPAQIVQFCAKSHFSRQKFVNRVAESEGDISVWAMIFYGLRLGLVKTALEFAEKADCLSDVTRYLAEYQKGDGWLPDSMRIEAEKTFRRLGGTEDVYKKAVYGVLSRVETNESFPGAIVTVSDWLWMKLCQVTLTGKAFTLSKLQDLVREKFDSDSDDAECFLVYVLTGQFESAVEKLFENLKYRIHAVHMAICLQNSRILVASNESADMHSESLDFIALIKTCVREFRRQNPETAVEYYYHLLSFPLTGSEFYEHNFRNMAELCLYKLARDTRSVGRLFGAFEAEGAGDGCLRRGLVFKFIADPEALMLAVAKDFETEGRFEEALALLEIVGERAGLLTGLVRILAGVVALPVEEGRRKGVYDVAVSCAKRFKQNSAREDTLLRNVYLLLDLVTFFDAFDRKQFRQAIVIMKQLRIVPLEIEQVLPALENYKLTLLTDVRRCVPEITLYTMLALVNWFAAEKEKTRGSRVLAGSAVEFLSTTQLDSSVSLGDDLHQVQERFRLQCRPILEFAQALPSPQLPDLLETLFKLESSIS